MILIISGPSGTGKNTVIRELLKTRHDIVHCISTTTRAIRENEKAGVDYYFVSRLEFIQMIQNRDFLEWAPVLGHYYGTSYDEIERIHKMNKIPVLDIDVQGALQVKKNETDVVLIFISPPSLEVLEERLRKRGTETSVQIKERLELAAEELKYKEDYDYQILNDDLATTTAKVEEIINQHKNSPIR